VVNFSFTNTVSPFASDFTPGTTTPVLVIETNATTFGDGFAGTIDDVVGAGPAFEPTPEPWSLLVWVGFGGIAGVYQWRRRRTK
jgi:hypothetical protein